jgi:cytochrome c-type biogenesis protein CcmE
MTNESNDSQVDPTGGQVPGSVAKSATLFGPRAKLAIAFVLVAGALIYFAVIAFQSATVNYKSVSDIASAGATPDGRTEGVKGKLVTDSYVRSADGITANFSIVDEGGSVTMPVTYAGEVGQVFFNEHSEIIVQGRVRAGGTFHADTLTVRCPSKYLTEQERAELAAQDGAQPAAPPYQPDYFSNRDS